ncbi:universal stress protein [Echinicola marina]|uniref:universal stress protein n=1 Tax=Echinicola marina TaxID=2859768 RepID=UPI001CF6B2F8|nr:universal stress protein [Echinicola marina]UCS93875.1 universal stress protein [Echinicola marina]
MKKILIPTDFSDCAKAAEKAGLTIAERAQAEIHFMHILSTGIDWVRLPMEKEDLYPETKAQIAHAKTALGALKGKAEKLGLKSDTVLLFDKGRTEIDRQIAEHEYDFVVMGSHGTSGINNLIGTYTQKVVRHSQSPVLVVKEHVQNFKVDSLIFAASFEEDIKAPFQKIVEFARLMGARIHLLYINTPFGFKETDVVKALMEAFKAECHHLECTLNIFDAFNEERGIQKFAESMSTDVIALVTHGKSGFMKMISPGITEHLVNHSGIPVLSVNINS